MAHAVVGKTVRFVYEVNGELQFVKHGHGIDDAQNNIISYDTDGSNYCIWFKDVNYIHRWNCIDIDPEKVDQEFKAKILLLGL